MTTLKKLETNEQREYWEFIEKTAQHSRERRPSWATKIEEPDVRQESVGPRPSVRAELLRCD